MPPPETNGYSRDSRCGRSGTAVGTGVRCCSTNARASGILRGLRRVTWAVTGYDDDDTGFNHRRVEPLDHFAFLIASGAEALSGRRAPWLNRRGRFSRLTD
jgi:hypothetical protein